MRLVTEDTAPPVPEAPPSVRSPPHMVASSVIQSQSGTPNGMPRQIASTQKPVYNTPSWQPPPKSADHLCAQTRSLDETIAPYHMDQLSVLSWCGQTPLTSTPLLMWATSVLLASQNFAEESLKDTQRSCHISTRITLSTILQYTPVFAIANDVAWCPQRMI